MSVRFTLVDRQLKLFKHGLQSLQKIGSELLLEALPARVRRRRLALHGCGAARCRLTIAPAPQIVLRTINSSLSAYLSVTYNAAFFDSYDVLDCTVVQAGLLMKVGAGGCWWVLGVLGAGEPLTHCAAGPAGLPASPCRCPPRCAPPAPSPAPRPQHVLSVFRTQRVERILFDLSTVTCKATVTLHCENGARGSCACRRLCRRARPAAGAAGGGCWPPARSCSLARPPSLGGPPWRAPAGLVKSYKVPTMDSEILQVAVCGC